MLSFTESAKAILAHGSSATSAESTAALVKRISRRVKNALTRPPAKKDRIKKQNNVEYLRSLVEEKHPKRFPGDRDWLQDKRLHPLIDHIVHQWEEAPPNKKFRRDRRQEESFLHEFRVLHKASSAVWIPAEERAISALVAGGHDFFEKIRENRDPRGGLLQEMIQNIMYGSPNEQLPFLSVAEQLWPEPRDHTVIAQAWALLTDPEKLGAKKLVGKARIEHQQNVAQNARPDQFSHVLYARAKLLDKTDNFMSYRQDIFAGRLKLTLESAFELAERTADNMVVIRNLGVVLPREQIHHGLLHGEKLIKTLHKKFPELTRKTTRIVATPRPSSPATNG